MTRIAVVGVACRYPDAATPQQLWENVVTGRRAFRRLPAERMRLEDYWSADPAAPDRFYASNAAVIEGYEFDRVAYKVAGSTYRATDLTHWLALDMAAQALADGGFPGGEGLPRDRTAVVVGNTLTGEFTRANVMRLRWPYVRRVVGAALRGQGWDDDQLAPFLAGLETSYKEPFPVVAEDSLAGGLSNTIAGRICNHFDLHGGGYTVDGACASSLLSVVNACAALTAGDADVVVAGGVDLSIDPFEMVGFAKTGALATGEMRVYDRRSNGFWPGEGCGMVVLMRESDAVAQGRRIYASVAGWGVSSDGHGGITRPEAAGYRLALARAYERAGFGPDTVALFEGHGTGTAVGDATELQALSATLRAADPQAGPAAIGSVKGLIGHTKAAAGIAGLIKAVLALRHQVIPPSTGCVEPHPELTGDRPALRPVSRAEPWPAGAALRAGVSAMGFGGINSHVVLEGPERPRRAGLDRRTERLADSAQDTELLLVDAGSPAELGRRLADLAGTVAALSYAELGDLAAELHRQLRGRALRAAVVVRDPQDAERALRQAADACAAGTVPVLDTAGGVFVGRAGRPARIGYLFPGQGSGRGAGGALRRRFALADEVFRSAVPVPGAEWADTAAAQPRIVTGSLAGLRALAVLGLDAVVAVGHSLGEITALHWAGAMDEDAVRELAQARGAVMSAHARSGTMAGLAAGPKRAAGLVAGTSAVIAGLNGPGQTVIAGDDAAVAEVCRRADTAGVVNSRLPVSHAFHSPLMAPAGRAFADWLAGRRFGPLRRRVESTVTGLRLPPDTDVSALLFQQIEAPVQFATALSGAHRDVDLLIEVGPGRVLTGLAREQAPDVPVLPLDTDAESLRSLLTVVAAAYVLGGPGSYAALFEDRMTRPFDEQYERRFFANPCESVPSLSTADFPSLAPASVAPPEAQPVEPADSQDALHILRTLVATRAELPAAVVHENSRLLDDLHLSSILVGQLVGEAARSMGMAGVAAPQNFATATLRELADALETLRDGPDRPVADPIGGVATWVRSFGLDWVEEPVPVAVADDQETDTDQEWEVFGDHPLAGPLRRELDAAALGGGVLVCLAGAPDPAQLSVALRGMQAALRRPPGSRLVVVQQAPVAAAMAKTARLEGAGLRTTVVRTAPDPAAVPLIVAEVAATKTFTEVEYDAAGVRRVPILRTLPGPGDAERTEALGPGDVLLVTGGGRGITAECAAALAEGSGARLIILGRSDPAADEELAGNLRRLESLVAHVRYLRADVSDPAAVRAAVTAATAELGPVTAVLHGAGENTPTALTDLDDAAVRRAFAPKVDGLHAVLAAVEPDRLRLLITFGSIIGRAGLHGEAHYAEANEWLAELTRTTGERLAHCRAVCVEWSVWSGVGMGERLSVVESLSAIGVTPISLDEGLRVLREVVADPRVPPLVVVTGRTGGLETLRYQRPELPLLRFVERPRVFYPGIELVTEVELDPAVDLYLPDHELDGSLLFPAVLGLEAMAQVATSLTRDPGTPLIEDARFERPVIVPPLGTTTIRIAALVRADDRIDVVIRSAETGYAVDHFRATMCFGPADSGPPQGGAGVAADLAAVPLEPRTDLYDRVLFQAGRFRRLLGYRFLAARQVEVDIATRDTDRWFGHFVAAGLVLGDPGSRDAFMHGIQVCVPDAVLLPLGIDRIWSAGPKLSAAEAVVMTAREQAHEGSTYVYDLDIRDGSGEVVEQWTGLRLRAVQRRTPSGSWPAALTGPLVQRRLAALLGREIAVSVAPHDGVRRPADLVSRALGRTVEIRHRPDGRPEADDPRTISISYSAAADLAVAGTGTISCDIEQVVPRSAEAIAGLLGSHSRVATLLAADLAEPAEVAATRVWSALECLQKAGRPGTILTVLPGAADGWAVLRAGDARIATLVVPVGPAATVTVLAVLTEEER
jgi:enediyne polyketide synthase